MANPKISSYNITVFSEESSWNHLTHKQPEMGNGLLVIGEDDGTDAVYVVSNLIGYHVTPIYEK